MHENMLKCWKSLLIIEEIIIKEFSEVSIIIIEINVTQEDFFL